MAVVTQKGLDNHCFSKPGQITRTPLESLAGGHMEGRAWQTRKAAQQNLPMWKGKGKSERRRDLPGFLEECQRMSTIILSELESENI